MAPCGWEITPTCSAWSSYTADQKAQALALATSHMWAATGRRFGACEVTVRLHNPVPAAPAYQTWPVEYDGFGGGEYGFGPVIVGGEWYNAGRGGCGCAGPHEVPLDGPTTKANIVSVTVDGAVVPTSAYQVHNGYLLVRVDGQAWPTCADPTTNDFEVTYRRGEPVPADVAAATGILACEWAKAVVGGTCALPQRMVSLTRQGVELEVEPAPTSFEDRMLTGLPDVDRVITAVNPGRLQGRPQVFSPDLPTARVIT